MQRLEFANKKSNDSIVSKNKREELTREVKGAALSQTRNVFYMSGAKDLYYVQSERSEDIYYMVKYNPSVVEYCTCPDNSIRLEKCKHIWSIEKSIVKGTLKEIEKFNGKTFANQNKIPVVKQQSKSWKDGIYVY